MIYDSHASLRAMQDIRCTKCNAAPGQPCFENGKRREPHGKRVTDYRREEARKLELA